MFAGVAHVDTVRVSEGLRRLRRGGLARISGEMTPPSSSRGVGGAERVRRNCCRPRRARQWKHRMAFARLRGVQQHLRSTGAGRGRSRSSSMGSTLPRSRRGERFMIIRAVRADPSVDHGVGKMVHQVRSQRVGTPGPITAPRENRLSGAPNAANVSEASRADSCRQVFPSPPLCRIPPRRGGERQVWPEIKECRESAEPWLYAAKASRQ